MLRLSLIIGCVVSKSAPICQYCYNISACLLSSHSFMCYDYACMLGEQAHTGLASKLHEALLTRLPMAAGIHQVLLCIWEWSHNLAQHLTDTR